MSKIGISISGALALVCLALIFFASIAIAIWLSRQSPREHATGKLLAFSIAVAVMAGLAASFFLGQPAGSGSVAFSWSSSTLGMLVLTALFVAALLAAMSMLREKKQGPLRDALMIFPIVTGLFLGLAALLFTPGLASYAWVALEVIALGFYTIGLIVGFLFVVTRYADGGSSTNTAGPSGQRSSGGASLLPNTNLAKISDWLTTAITAITLSQLKGIPAYVAAFGNYLQQSLPLAGPHAYGGALAVALLAYFPALGFISGCIVTMLYISPLLRDTNIFAEVTSQTLVESSLVSTTAAIADKSTPGPAAAAQAVSDTARIIARDVTKMSLAELTLPGDKITWANAQATLTNWTAAVRGYQEALIDRPNDPLLLENYANAMLSDGQPPEQVAKVYERVLPLVSEPAAKARILANLALCYLYVPGRFNTALQYINQVLEDPSLPKASAYYFYRACANGQKWKALPADANDARRDLHDSILKDTKTAIAMNPDLKARFLYVADPKFPDKDPIDNDLEAFAADNPDFQELIGMNSS